MGRGGKGALAVGAPGREGADGAVAPVAAVSPCAEGILSLKLVEFGGRERILDCALRKEGRSGLPGRRRRRISSVIGQLGVLARGPPPSIGDLNASRAGRSAEPMGAGLRENIWFDGGTVAGRRRS